MPDFDPYLESMNMRATLRSPMYHERGTESIMQCTAVCKHAVNYYRTIVTAEMSSHAAYAGFHSKLYLPVTAAPDGSSPFLSYMWLPK